MLSLSRARARELKMRYPTSQQSCVGRINGMGPAVSGRDTVASCLIAYTRARAHTHTHMPLFVVECAPYCIEFIPFIQ